MGQPKLMNTGSNTTSASQYTGGNTPPQGTTLAPEQSATQWGDVSRCALGSCTSRHLPTISIPFTSADIHVHSSWLLPSPQSHSTVDFPPLDAPWYRKMFAFAGLGFLVAVGYMDPGNWATDLAAGSQFGYQLLFVVLLSSCCAMFLQYLALKLGIASDRDLAQACRDAYHPHLNKLLWVVAELAIAATDLGADAVDHGVLPVRASPLKARHWLGGYRVSEQVVGRRHVPDLLMGCEHTFLHTTCVMEYSA